MITILKDRSIRLFLGAAIAFVIGTVLIGLSYLLGNPPVAIGVLIAVATVASFITMVVSYIRGCVHFAAAKGYSSGVLLIFPVGFLLPIICVRAGAGGAIVAITFLLGALAPIFLVMLLPDKGNTAKFEEEMNYTGPRCVACYSRLVKLVRLCPICGWTQPRADIQELNIAPPTQH